MTIYNLNSIPTGKLCTIKWLTGKIADTFRNIFSLIEETDMYVINNLGKGGVIVRYGDKSLAISEDAADYIKVECA